MPRLSSGHWQQLLEGDEIALPPAVTPRPRLHRSHVPHLSRPRMRRDETAPFRCGRCRQMVGQTVSGGRHRNHCPFCLTSRHVDQRRPGDRSSPCRALMAPTGIAARPDGEQRIIHRCNGCGVIRRIQVAADDDPVALLKLPPYADLAATGEEEEAIA